LRFSEKLVAAQTRANSWLCVGLDTDFGKMPPRLLGHPNAVVDFNRVIIEATRDLVCAYKPNLAFYLAHGSAGIAVLAETIAAIPRELPIVLDAKFGDIESSARGYAQFAFESLKVDAVTVSPYLGADALTPFLEYADRCLFVLAHTSNPSSRDLQDALVATGTPEELPEPLYIQVARLASRLSGSAEVGLVAGATWPEQLADLREANRDAIMLVPGIGAQGGSLAQAVEYGKTASGIGPLINAARSILYASPNDDYAEAARAAAQKMKDDINQLRSKGVAHG
jgi:orotidine-5'-phosphate decarboxylase